MQFIHVAAVVADLLKEERSPIGQQCFYVINCDLNSYSKKSK